MSESEPQEEKPKAKPPKEKKAKEKAKKEKGKGKKAPAAGGVSIAVHPQASHAVRTLKAWGGLIGFALGAYLSQRAGAPIGVLGLRALASGLGGYMIAWFCGVVVWRALVSAEMRAHMELRARAEQAKAAKQ